VRLPARARFCSILTTVRAFWLIVLVPLALVAYLALRVSREGAQLERHQLQGLLDGRLADVRSRADQAMSALERDLDARLADAPADADGLRALARRTPLARQLFRVDGEGRLVFPNGGADASDDERAFLQRTAPIFTGRAILNRDGASATDAERGPGGAGAPGLGDSLIDLAARQSHGWLSWYWAEGLHLLFWRRAAGGGVVGVEVERIGVLARVVGALPTRALEEGRMELVDSRGQTVHQWGPMVAGADPAAKADAALALAPPLDSWQLRYYISPAQRAAFAGGPDAGLFLGLGAVALAMLGLAVYIYREYTRSMRDAAQRVGFVTQVSHELRTPLTNIRMYAELLEDAADDDDDQQRRARVIVSESQRLGRLIDNVLAFARDQRGQLAPRRDAIDVDEVVRRTAAQFEPALAARGIELELVLGGPLETAADPDGVEQIVANLLSNVDKYAAAGGHARISTTRAGDRAVVRVADRGPGIPAAHRDAIFRPFHRVSDSLTEGASGTGIGLAIARQLARAGGGELSLEPSERGACFALSLPLAEELS